MALAIEDILETIIRLSKNGESFSLGTVIETTGSTPAKVGAKIIVGTGGRIAGTVGGGSVERELIQDARNDLSEGVSRIHKYSLDFEDKTGQEGKSVGAVCGGSMRIFVEVRAPAQRLIIFGGGHVALPLSRMAGMLGLHTTIIDKRSEFASKERFPNSEILCEDFVKAAKELEYDKNSYIVIMTPDHSFDEAVLENVVRRADGLAAYIGMMGSRKKVKTIFKNLKERGVSSAALKRVKTPIGLNIGATTPEEIALSIISEVIASRYGERGEPMSSLSSNVE